ncbi:MAG: hypothetical protein ACE361_20675 [Aureliella sp.]
MIKIILRQIPHSLRHSLECHDDRSRAMIPGISSALSNQSSGQLGWITRVSFLALCSLAASATYSLCVAANHPQDSSIEGPVRVAKLLWKAAPVKAAQTLSKVIQASVETDQTEELLNALDTMKPLFAEATAEKGDARRGAALAALLLLDGDDSKNWKQFDEVWSESSEPMRELLASVRFQISQQDAFDSLSDRIQSHQSDGLGIWIASAYETDRIRATQILLKQWQDLPSELQVGCIEPMTATKETMLRAIDAVSKGHVSRDLFNANQLRKWVAVDENLREKVESLWGKIRESQDEARAKIVSQTLKLLNSGKSGSVERGELVFNRVCGQCHQLHGKGLSVGPDITGNGRGNLKQLVSNVMDPSLVIGEAFQAKTVLTYDGEVVSGLVAGEDENYLTLKLQGGKLMKMHKEDDIELLKDSTKSLMPEGLESQMQEQETLDLFAYLSLLKPLGSDDNSLIPGTPETLVQP